VRIHRAKNVALPDHTAHAPGDELPTANTTRGPSIRDSFRHD
jgi:hypothetical protein